MLEQNKTLFERFVDEVFNKKNVAVIDELMDPNMVEHNLDSFVERPVRDGPWSARVSGREAPRAVGC